MTKEEMAKIEAELSTKLCPLIDKMLMAKNINAKRGSANFDEYFLYMDMLVDAPWSTKIIKISLQLMKSVLFGKDSCDLVDQSAGYPRSKFNGWTLAAVRTARIVYEICMTVAKGTMQIFHSENKLYASFADPRGHIWYHN